MQKRYFSYLLRIWLSNDPESPACRASLEDPCTRQVIGFSSLDSLCKFLLKLATFKENASDPDNQSTPSKKEPNS
jgi:hypothetical protein